MTAASVDVIETVPAIAPLADEWETLADRVGVSPLLRPGWVDAWWRAFGRGRLEVVTARREGRLVGVLPLYRRGAVTRSTTNVHSAEFGPVAEDDRARGALADEAFRRGGRRLSLFFLDRRDPALASLHAAAERTGWRTFEQLLERSPYIELAGDFADFESTLARQLRSEVRRRRRRLEEDGPLALEVWEGGEGLEALLEEGLSVEAAAWKGHSGTAITSQAETDAFYRRLADWAAERGFLRLAFLRQGPVPLAFDLALEGGGAHYLLKTGYDPAYAKAAPGIILRHEMIARAFSSDLHSYEFLGHDHPWKLRWTSTCRERVVLRAFAPSPAGSLNRLTAMHWRPLAKRLLGRS